MAEKIYIRLNRQILSISGEDRRTFVQGLISNDVLNLTEGEIRWGAMLTPQGKFLWDLFYGEQNGELFIDVEAERFEAFRKKISLYKLKSKVTITARPELSVFAVLGDCSAVGGLCAADPRHAGLGCRAWLADEQVLHAAGFAPALMDAWDSLRLPLGIPDGSRDMQVEHALLLEHGFDELHGVDFNKGCYMGQELTARTKYRGLVKKRLLPVRVEGAMPEAGAILRAGEAEAGEMRSHAGDWGLALIRLEHRGQVLTCGDSRLTVHVPDWMVLPE